MRTITLIASGGLLSAGVAGLVAWRQAGRTKDHVVEATGGDAALARAAGEHARAATVPGQVQEAAREALAAAEAAPPSSDEVRKEAEDALKAAGRAQTQWEIAEAAAKVERVAEKMTRNTTVKIRATGYWPVSADASEAERRMEGGNNGAAKWNGRRVVDPTTGKRVVLRTVEQYLADGKPFSISGDPGAWPFGQLVRIAWHDGRVVEGRVVDTGENFRGSSKVYRAAGREPLDIRVNSRRTKVPTETTAEVVRGDHWDRQGADLVASRFRGQSVVGVCAYCADGFCTMCDARDGGACSCKCCRALNLLGVM